jgi:hypothetical protein
VNAAPSPRAFYGKLFLLAVAIAAFTVGMAFLLITFKVENTQRDLRHGRFDLIARDVDRVVEQNLGLGMSMDEMTTLPAVLARRRLADAGIAAIDVADRNGRIVYSSDATAVGNDIPPSWRAAIRQQQILQTNKSTSRTWRIKDDAENIAGSTIDNSFGVTQGYIAVRYTGAEGVSAREALREAMLPVVMTVFAATTLVLFGILSVLARRFERDTASAAAYAQGATDTDVVMPEPNEWRVHLDPLAARFDAAETALAQWSGAAPPNPPTDTRR